MESRRQWVDQVKELLAGAEKQRGAAFSSLDALKGSIDGALRAVEQGSQGKARADTTSIPPPTRRRHLLAQINLKGRRYGLCDEIQAFVYAAGHEVAQELGTDKLEALNTWLDRWAEAGDMSCTTPYEI